MSELNKHYSIPEGEEDYDHNIPLAKQVCRGTEDDNQYLEGMLKKTAVSAKENMDETWFDGGYNSNQNIALAHVEFGLTCHNLSSVVYLTWGGDEKVTKGFRGVLVSTDFVPVSIH
ncbi:hypothetical protein METP3_02776 [Methanosarcinales archaeon]|nr:hypothetical protein METP3_02776 [Methanosarcinales archaeon]